MDSSAQPAFKAMNTGLPTRTYPPAPWQLRGSAIQVARLLDISVARQFVPATAQVLSVLPGKTLAVLYCAQYRHGSSLIYNELALAPALIRAGGRAGFWISHIYVDNPLSVAGGREIWHLPKLTASFEWSADAAAVTVTQGALTLLHASLRGRAHASLRGLAQASLQGRAAPPSGLNGFPLPLIAPVMIEQPAGFRMFWLRGSCRLARSRGEIAADAASPVAQLHFAGSHRIHAARALSLKVSAPRH